MQQVCRVGSWVLPSLSTYTPDSGCGGTDGDVYLVLEGDNGVRYPRPGYWYVLDNSGNDRERGDTDSYWLETGSMKFVRRCKIYFRYLEDADAWQVGDCTLNKHTWDPLFGRWLISEFINRWQYSSCLRYTGW